MEFARALCNDNNVCLRGLRPARAAAEHARHYPEIGARIGAIVTFGSAIEYHLERYLWHALKLPYKNIRPVTDLKNHGSD